MSELLAGGVPRVRALLAVRVGTLRFERGMTWTQLGARAKVSGKQIEGIERGTRDPQFSTVVRIAKALGMRSLDELLDDLPFAAVA